VLERVGNLLLLIRRQHLAVLAIFVNANDSVASMIAPANARPNDSRTSPAAEFTPAPRCPLLVDRRQRVVVELRHQQPEPHPAMISGITSTSRNGRAARWAAGAHADGER
jgi:hypothetical protein